MTTIEWKGVVTLANGLTVTLTGTCDVGEVTGDYYGPRWLGIETDTEDLDRCMWALLASGWGGDDANRISAAIHRACREAVDDWFADHPGDGPRDDTHQPNSETAAWQGPRALS